MTRYVHGVYVKDLKVMTFKKCEDSFIQQWIDSRPGWTIYDMLQSGTAPDDVLRIFYTEK